MWQDGRVFGESKIHIKKRPRTSDYASLIEPTAMRSKPSANAGVTHLENILGILTLNSYETLLEKCRRENAELQVCNLHPDYDFLLFNIILSMNHLFEWFLKDENVPQDKKMGCIKIFNPYRTEDNVSRDFKSIYSQLDDFPEVNRSQELIRELCNKAKHFKKKNVEVQDGNYIVECGNESMECGNPDTVCGGFDHYIYFVEVDGDQKNLEVLISSLINKWSDFVENEV